jgi:NAD(P)-dependent dehydrogenase (short-subunit alcohol dehydrogenase family)
MADHRVALVTGASSGIGAETASLLAARGYRTFGASREPQTRPAPKGVEMLQLDVRSDESAWEVVEDIHQKAGRLDILVNNAGFGLFGGIEETSFEEARGQLETNFWGAVRMTARVLPRMREQRFGRIINISSVLGFMAAPFQGFYVASKHALEGYSEVLDLEVREFGIRIVLIEPSSISSSFIEHHQDVKARLDPYTTARERVLAMLTDRIHHGSHPKLVARRVLAAIRASDPDVRYTAGSAPACSKSHAPSCHEPVRLGGTQDLCDELASFLLAAANPIMVNRGRS